MNTINHWEELFYQAKDKIQELEGKLKYAQNEYIRLIGDIKTSDVYTDLLCKYNKNELLLNECKRKLELALDYIPTSPEFQNDFHRIINLLDKINKS